MEVNPGYKQTEIGVIPDDWDVKHLHEVADLQVGYAFKSIWFGRDRGIRLLRGENVGYGKADWSDTRTLEGKTEDAFRSYLLYPGEVVIGMDRTFTKSGTKVTLLREGDCPCLLVQRVGRFVPRDCSKSFLWAVISSEPVQARLRQEQKGMDIPHLSRSEILHPLAAFPRLSEQRAIAAVLSDVDALLGGLDRLIAKKRDLKQAAMQQLLTGQTRLPGFSGKWEVQTLDEVASMAKGVQLHSSETSAEGEYPHFNGGISPSSYTNKANTPADTIAISEGGNSCGYVQFISEPFWCGGHCYAVIPKEVDKRFLYHALKGQQSAIMGLRVGSGLPNVQKTALAAFNLLVPSNHLEQAAIAAILSDMYAELAALEARRDKTRALKQAMMQELLTGKTRLVKPEVAHD